MIFDIWFIFDLCQLYNPQTHRVHGPRHNLTLHRALAGKSVVPSAAPTEVFWNNFQTPNL